MPRRVRQFAPKGKSPPQGLEIGENLPAKSLKTKKSATMITFFFIKTVFDA